MKWNQDYVAESNLINEEKWVVLISSNMKNAVINTLLWFWLTKNATGWIFKAEYFDEKTKMYRLDLNGISSSMGDKFDDKTKKQIIQTFSFYGN